MPKKNTTQVVCVAEFRAFEGKVDADVRAAAPEGKLAAE